VRFLARDLAAATGGTLHGPNAVLEGVAIDSRTIRRGQLFVPIVGERDGHDFIAAAIDAGAAATLTHAAVPDGVTAIAVADTAAALLDIGRTARTRLGALVVAVTGSVGKTSVKDLTAAALARRWRTAASERSFNNELGVPLTLANVADDTQAAVIEMGARGRGHIRVLCDVAHPAVGVVTAVAPAHVELFGSVEEVAEAKSELVQHLPSAGTAVLNADDDRVLAMRRRTPARVLTYSTALMFGADLVAEGLQLDGELRPRFRLRTPNGSVDVRLQVRGVHQAANALAAAGAALACGVDLEDIAAGLAEAELSPWRMDLRRSPAGAWVLNDSYNANPSSMEAALRSLASLPARRRVAVLGFMAELGGDATAAHLAVADLAAQLGIDVLPVGTDLYGAPPVDDPLAALGALAEGDAVLVKGSRVAGLEAVAAALIGEGD
jgi:UDP-N-acetylmuramoyl-tripeptide--D-alanyl-D-alanine ligase